MDDRRRDSLVADLRHRAHAAGWTGWQLACRIHQGAGTPTLLMAWRLAAGITQAELAEGVRQLAADAGSPCSPSTPSCQQISRWENGHDKPGGFYQGLLAVWYRTDPARLGLIGDLRPRAETDDQLALAVEEDDVNRRNFLSVAAVPVLFQLDQIRRRMDADLRHVVPQADTDKWAQIAADHVTAYGNVPPSVLLGQLAPDLSELADLVGQYPQQRDLTRIAARLCGLTGALHTDLGHDRAARDWLHTGARYAAMSGDLATEYWIAMAQTMTAVYPPDADRALALSSRGLAMFGAHQSAAAAQLTGLLARACAMVGDTRGARAHLAAAERMTDHLTSQQADEPFFGFPVRAMLMYTSHVLTAAGDPAAWNAQANALSCYPASDPIDRPLILLGRARHLADRGDPVQAASVASAAITDLPPQWRIPLLLSEARSLGRTITATSARIGRQYLEVLKEAVPA